MSAPTIGHINTSGHTSAAPGDVAVQLLTPSGHIDTSLLPPEVATALHAFDEDGNGIEIHELVLAAKKWQSSKGCKDTFDLSAFPDNLQASLKVFDQDGDGHVNKAELAAAAHMYADSKRSVRLLRKVVFALAAVLLLTLLAITGLVFMVVDMSKETKTGGDGVMTAKGDPQMPIRVDTVESFTTVWDLPEVSTDKLAYMKSITIYVDMTSVPTVGSLAEATFKVTGAYKPNGNLNRAFLTTAEGYTIAIDSSSRTGTIEMGVKGTFPITTDPKMDSAARRLQTKATPPGEAAPAEPRFFSKKAFAGAFSEEVFFFNKQDFLDEGTETNREEDGRRLNPRRLNAFSGSLMTSGSFTMVGGSGD